MSIECGICCTIPSKQTFMDCRQCMNKLCSECFANLRDVKCPYCRGDYLNNIHDDTEDEDFDDDDDDSQVDPNDDEMPYEPPVLRRQDGVIREMINDLHNQIYLVSRDAIRRHSHQAVNLFLTGNITHGEFSTAMQHYEQLYRQYRQ